MGPVDCPDCKVRLEVVSELERRKGVANCKQLELEKLWGGRAMPWSSVRRDGQPVMSPGHPCISMRRGGEAWPRAGWWGAVSGVAC
jgi:hypothetical protein